MQASDFRQRTLDFYDNFAWVYDLTEWIRSHTRHRAVALSNFQAGDKVLDVCTGTGELALNFARRGANVTAIDLSAGMLGIGARKSSSLPIEWIEMDATRLHFPDNHFDVSAISLALHHMPEDVQIQVLKEMARVTRYKIVIVELHVPYNKKLHKAWGAVHSILDQSEYMKAWVGQNVSQTLEKSGLKIEKVELSTISIHRIMVCTPQK